MFTHAVGKEKMEVHNWPKEKHSSMISLTFATSQAHKPVAKLCVDIHVPILFACVTQAAESHTYSVAARN